MTVRWLDDQEQRIWRQWLRANSLLAARLAREMVEDSGLSLPDFEVLVTLSETVDHRDRVVALADGLRWERSRLSHHLTRMEKRGLVQRQVCPQDRRGAFVALTAAGMAALEGAAPGHVREVRSAMFDVLNEEELKQLDALTSKLLVGLEADDSRVPDQQISTRVS